MRNPIILAGAIASVFSPAKSKSIFQSNRHYLRKFLLCVPLLVSFNLHAVTLDKAPDAWSFQSRLVAKSLLVDIIQKDKRIFACGERGHIIYSDDDGNTWVQAKVPTMQLITGIDFPTVKKGWAVGHDGNILHSEDGGENWILQYDGLAYKSKLDKENLAAAQQKLQTKKQRVEDLQKQLASANESAKANLETKMEEVQAEIAEIEDGMPALQRDVANTVETPFLDVWFKDESKGIAIGAFGKFFETTDGGKNWVMRKDRIDNPDEYHYNSIEATSDGTLIIAAEVGKIFRSRDYGQTWQELPSLYEGSYFGLAINEKSKSVLVFGITGALFESKDMGDSWQPVNAKLSNSLNGGVYRKDGGATVVGVGGYVITSHADNPTIDVDVLPERQNMNKVIETSTGKLIAVGMGGVFIIPEKRGADANNVVSASSQKLGGNQAAK